MLSNYSTYIVGWYFIAQDIYMYFTVYCFCVVSYKYLVLILMFKYITVINVIGNTSGFETQSPGLNAKEYRKCFPFLPL